MATNSSSNSPYSKTPVTNFYLDIWVPILVPSSADDQLYIIETKYNKRPDLLASDMYGTVALYWVFAMRNQDILVDPIENFTAGTSIYLPSKSTIQGLF